MIKFHPQPPAPEDLPELYLALKAHVEKLEGMVRQMSAEGTRATLDRPTWRDMQELRAEIERLRTSIHLKDA
jgi:hypothetical protein